jgi:transcriptional regulator with XRE-family HTH domain
MEAEEVARPLLPWLGRACRQAREERGVVQVKIAAAIEVNQATIARFEDGTAWPRHPEEVLMAYASELDMDVRLLWLHAFVLWLEHEPVLDKESQEQIRAALKRLRISSGRRVDRAAQALRRAPGCSAVGCFESPLERLSDIAYSGRRGGFEGVVPLLVKADALARPPPVCLWRAP